VAGVRGSWGGGDLVSNLVNGGPLPCLPRESSVDVLKAAGRLAGHYGAAMSIERPCNGDAPLHTVLGSGGRARLRVGSSTAFTPSTR
jgi:hypothetical protein